MVDPVVLLALGWLAGMLSPAVIGAIKEQRESNAVVPAIKSELNEVSYRLVLAAYNVAMHLGTVDRALLEWVRDSLVLYQGTEPKARIAESVVLQLSLPDEQLAAYVAAEGAQGLQALVLVKFAVPFVDARIGAWHSLAPVVRLELQATRADIRLLDDLVDQSRSYFQLTFGKLEEPNYAIVVQNLRGVYMQYKKRCSLAADRMHRLQGFL